MNKFTFISTDRCTSKNKF